MPAEILAPAGNMDAFFAAMAAGADAVYMGLPQFGARAYAQNFTLEEARQVIEQAHLADMKIYITMNTLLEEGQMEAAYQQAKALYEMGVDALIVQDLGLIHYLHHRLPGLELHASTQISALLPEHIEQLQKLGIRRVVLAREATIDEIQAAAKTGMELEVFVHGALCISYSGQCQFSRVRYGRSGNKGACAQPCRMEYTLLENGRPVATQGNFLLSPRDLSILQDIPALEKAGVASLKIEGRMKSPAYVYTSVIKARKAREGKKLSAQDEKELMVAFNRAYTRGHTFGQKGKDLMNARTGNHQGIPVGKVLKVTPQRITIRLSEDLAQNDGIRFENERGSVGMRVNFLYKNGKLVKEARAGDVVEVNAIKGVYPKAMVRKTVDSLLEKEVDHAMKQTRRQASIQLHLRNEGPGHPLVLEAADGIHHIQIEGPAAQTPVSRPTLPADFKKQLAKTGNTWAKADSIEVDLAQDIFVPLKEINQLRNEALEALKQARLQVNVSDPLPYTWKPQQPEPLKSYVEIQKKEQLPVHLPAVSEFPIPQTQYKKGIHASANQPAAISAHLEKAPLIDGMNITNSYALAALLELGYQGAVLSEELSEEGRKAMLEAFEKRYGFQAPVVMSVYEHPRLMLMEHCPINTALKDGTRSKCSLCRQNTYTLKGKDGKEAILYGSPDCQMRLYDEQAADRIDEIPQLAKEGIPAFRIALTTENGDDAAAITRRFEQQLEQLESRTPEPAL